MALNFPDNPTTGQIYTDSTAGFSYEWDGVVWQSYSPPASKNISIIDDISGSFNSSTQTFALAVSGTSLTPANAQQLRVVLGGIVQEPGVDYTVSGSDITFTTPPTGGLDCSIVSLGPAVPLNVIADGSAGDTQVQFNDGGRFAGSADLTWDDTAKELGVGGDINLDDGGTYATTLQLITPTANRTISFPDATGTVGLVGGSSGQLVYNNAGSYAGGPLYDSTAGTLGYPTGGTITQSTSKSTGVTLNGASGKITLNAAALNADTTVSFTLTNSSITANDLLVLNHVSGGTAGAYLLNAQAAAGSASINVRNITAGSLSEAIVIGFAVLKT